MDKQDREKLCKEILDKIDYLAAYINRAEFNADNRDTNLEKFVDEIENKIHKLNRSYRQIINWRM
jgi:hypothetical protein